MFSLKFHTKTHDYFLLFRIILREFRSGRKIFSPISVHRHGDIFPLHRSVHKKHGTFLLFSEKCRAEIYLASPIDLYLLSKGAPFILYWSSIPALFDLYQFIFPAAKPERRGRLDRVHAVSGLHSLQEMSSARIVGSVDQVDARLVDRHRIEG